VNYLEGAVDGFILAVIILIILIATKVASYNKEKSSLKALQLADVDSMTGANFENYVALLLRHQGFKAQVTRASNDFGVDIVAEKNKLKYAVQVKRYSRSVSRRAVSDAAGGKSYYKCNAAMVVTNNFFTAGAKELASSAKCELVDRNQLAKWIIDYQRSNSTLFRAAHN
jgi:restriction system protein